MARKRNTFLLATNLAMASSFFHGRRHKKSPGYPSCAADRHMQVGCPHYAPTLPYDCEAGPCPMNRPSLASRSAHRHAADIDLSIPLDSNETTYQRPAPSRSRITRVEEGPKKGSQLVTCDRGCWYTTSMLHYIMLQYVLHFGLRTAKICIHSVQGPGRHEPELRPSGPQIQSMLRYVE